MARPKIFIVIVNYNSAKFLPACLNSLKNQTEQNFKLVVVDNASTDKSWQVVAKFFPTAKLILNHSNSGFPAGANQGIKYALKNGADLVILLGFDTQPDKNWLKELIKSADEFSRAGIIQSKILLYPSGQVQSLGNRISWLGFGYPSAQPQKNLDYASGTSMLVKKEVFGKIGFLDERLMFMEDLDFGRRARRAGFEIRLATGSIVAHHYQFFRYPKKLYFWLKSYCRYLWKNLKP